MKTLKPVYYSKQKLNDKIVNHFNNFGKFEYSESKREVTEFEFEFKDVNLNETGNFHFLICYGIDCGQPINFEDTIAYRLDSEGVYIDEYKLKLITGNYNPNKESLETILTEIKDKQDKTDEENEQYCKDIEDTNDILNQKYR